MREIVIRRGIEEDAVALRELRLEALRTSPESFGADYETDANRPLEDWQNRLRGSGDNSSVLFVACQGEQLVGMTGAFRANSSKMRHSATLYGVYVQKEIRGGGIAARLIDACTDWAREQDVVMARLAVVTTNASAIRCYLRCGFQVYGVESKALFYDGIYYDELLMAKSLQ